MVKYGWGKVGRKLIELATYIQIALFIFKLAFSASEWLVCSPVDFTQELSTKDQNCAQVTLVHVHSFKGEA